MPLTLVPQAGQTLNVTQNPILQNFTILNALGLGDGAYLPFTLGTPPNTAANQWAIFTKTGTISGTPELALRRPGTVGPTAGVFTITEAGLVGNAGWTRLPSGILIKWGKTSGTAYGSFVFPTVRPITLEPIPPFVSVFDVYLGTTNAGITDTNTFVRQAGFTGTQFNFYASARTTVTNALVNFSYLAIGLG